MFTHRSEANGNPSPNRDTVTAPQILDHELLRRIGGGSYGEVWLARNVLGSYRAVKIVYRRSFDHDRPFEREFEGVQKFEPISRTHESQVNILHVGRGEGYFYYVMDLADQANPAGQQVGKCESERSGLEVQPNSYVPRTLKFELHERGRLPVDQCIEIGLALTTALEHLHEYGLVHRDIKPSNIIFVGGVARLADIGLVATMDKTMSFVGTSGFLPPEGPGTPQGDIYSLGKVLYEISMGRDRQEFPKLPSDLAHCEDPGRLLELNAVILKACHRDPRQRYQTAQEMAADLQLLRGGKSVKQQRAIARRLAIAKGIVLAVIVLAGLFYAIPLSQFLKHDRVPNPEAQRLYELGRWHHQQLTDESLKKAIEYLNRAIQIDPEYVPAYTALFRIHNWSASGPEKLAKIKPIAAKLMSLAPNLAESHHALSLCKYLEGDWSRAEEEIQRALRLNRDYAPGHSLYCFYLSLQGHVERAKVHGKRAQELDPTSRIEATVAGFPFIAGRQYDGAIAQFRRALELDPNFALAHGWIGKSLEAKGEYLAALDEFEKNAVLSGMNEGKARQRFDIIRQAFVSSGPPGYWLKALEFELESEASSQEAPVADPSRWPLDGIYAQLGEKEKALALLEKDFEENGRNAGEWLKFEPLYEPLRDEPRFKALLKKVGLEK